MGSPQLLQLVNVFVGWSEELKAGNAVAALKQTLKPEATVKRDGEWRNIPVGTTQPKNPAPRNSKEHSC